MPFKTYYYSTKLLESLMIEDLENLPQDFFGKADIDTPVAAPDLSKGPSPSDRRKEVLLKIKSGELDPRHFPTIFKKFAELIDLSGKINIPQETYGRGLATKLVKFLITGKLGDALASHSMKEVQNIVKGAAAEVSRKLVSDHPSRDLASLEKRGVIDEIINFWVKENNYDLFHDEWVKKLHPLIHQEIMRIRQSSYKKNLSDI